MIRCLIADDEPIARQIVAGYIEQLPQLTLVGSCKNAFEVMQALRQQKVDLLFLDINMPKLSGLSLLRSLRHQPDVILTTAYAEHALEAFELSVIDYLLKPFSLERFFQAVQKVEEKRALATPLPAIPETSKEQNKTSIDHLFIKVDRQFIRVALADIHYVSAYGNYIKIHLNDEVLLSLQTLSEFLVKLPPQDFLQIHKSHLINFNRLQVLEGQRVKIKDGWLPIGKAHRAKLLERMNQL
jgi:DNA-binding LytR/AlgR family response regulator